jgi:hypothetical protein
MKLLKRSSEGAKKHLVLVTTESTLLPLAGAVGLHVAETAQSKPEIPLTIPISNAAKEKEDEPVSLDEGAEGFTAENAGDKPVGELAGGVANVPTRPDGIETLTLPDEAEADAVEAEAADTNKPSKEKHLKIPNFNKFRLRLLLALILALLIIGLIFALNVLPKATIKIGTNTSDTNVSLTITLNPSAQTLNLNTLTTPARSEQQQQTTTQQVNTTGQQNNGTAAIGQATLTNCSIGGGPITIPGGTGLSTSGLTYITQSSVTLSTSTFDGHGNCKSTIASSQTVNITAQNGGTKYNVPNGTSFTVAGYPDVTATGSTSGGTDSIVQVVAQADIDSAKQKLATQNTSSIKSALEQTLTQDGLYPLPTTFNAATPTITSSSSVGDPASSVTVTQAVTYTMYGVKKANLDALIANNVDSQINAAKQSIINDGLSSATITVASTSSSGEQIALQTTAVIGPDIHAVDIKKEVAGKKSGDAQSIIGQLPGVTSVSVQLSPFWVSSIPTNPSKVTVTIGKAT